MKFLTIIASIYFVALSCLPCSDVVEINFEKSSKELQSNHENHSHEKENHLCSPFCICNCCGSQIINHFKITTIYFPIATLKISSQVPTYTSIFTSNFYGSIWQPPQIA